MKPISSWGRLSHEDHQVIPLNDRHQAFNQIRANETQGGIAHGMGRSYGDVGLNPKGALWLTTGLHHLIHFDEHTGRLICESGVLLRDIQRLLIPRGWILPVTPGSQMVTVGGAIANDVHGKNHHLLGSFGDHVQNIKLIRTDGTIIECGPLHNTEWFSATLGGLGLTGVILEAEIQMRPTAGPWLDTESIPYSNLSEFFELADSSEKDWEHTVSWIDCISGKGQGIFMRANPNKELKHAPKMKAEKKMPFVPPISLVNSLTLRPFNFLYRNHQKYKAGTSTVHYEPFFYPLDKLLEWNRMYGPKGFFQYQSVVPRNVGQDATQAMLKEIEKSGEGSFLAVLKTFGNRESLGMLSFPEPGVTLALDFPNHASRTHKLMNRLDAIVKEAKGRIYPAKDARMPRELFEAGYPKLNEFLKYRDAGISSSLSRRLLGS
ncbi:FAD-binding oxidoreductase [Polynucleobacter asymbioticus]|uniref:FAD linked oxidase domain protein n=1 Tax=Polynucleobacter asymbioticus (strain DSM 18221 / CIP 109841 / QLW-P1DMWA-1) TaxID=312153 RepID=A4SVN5_POLAQ|nr:FAD-binding oxidoreductase [Polynucleobacter asymbioticus]ABP33549.1 FAD linked oxidase domain protein [Polynucleobacter asymbioticus QLW-P1DMWA-1]